MRSCNCIFYRACCATILSYAFVSLQVESLQSVLSVAIRSQREPVCHNVVMRFARFASRKRSRTKRNAQCVKRCMESLRGASPVEQ